MGLVLTIENEAALADGGPLTYAIEGQRGFDIGRDTHLDWTLPDPSRYISSRHCEVRYQDGAYWLHDVSTNGTYLNGSDRRMSEPHRLRSGDRIAIGHYLIRVDLSGETGDAKASVSKAGAAGKPPSAAASPRPPAHDVWALDETPSNASSPVRAAPAAGRSFVPSSAAPPDRSDFMDWAAELPPLEAQPAAPPPAVVPRAPAAAGARRLKDMLPADDGWWDPSTERMPAEKPVPATRPSPSPEPVGRAEPQPPRKPAPPAADKAAPFGAAAAPTPAPATAGATPPRQRDETALFIRAFAEGAGMNPADLAHHDPESLARLLGGLVRQTSDELRQLLEARFEARRMARSSQQTQISGMDNNPLKFSPTVDDALRLMLGPPTKGYLGAGKAVQSSFKDVKTHQLETYAAMQAALLELAEEFDPRQIDASLGRDGGIGNLVSSRKARMWDVFVARWEARTLRQDNGILGAFMEYFSKHYDREK